MGLNIFFNIALKKGPHIPMVRRSKGRNSSTMNGKRSKRPHRFVFAGLGFTIQTHQRDRGVYGAQSRSIVLLFIYHVFI